MLDVGSWIAGGGLSARQVAMNSWRRGLNRWRIRDGPIGSHHELARAEKWESSSGETEDVECQRDVARLHGLVEGRGEIWRRYDDGPVAVGVARRARRGRERVRRDAMVIYNGQLRLRPVGMGSVGPRVCFDCRDELCEDESRT